MSEQRDPNRMRPRGWSVLSVRPSLGSLPRGHDRYLRSLWETRRRGLSRAGLVLLALWGSYSLIGSDHGLLRLQMLRRQETDLQGRVQDLTVETHRIQRQLNEDPLTEMERPMREKYRKSKPNEIVYRVERTPPPAPDSTGSIPASR